MAMQVIKKCHSAKTYGENYVRDFFLAAILAVSVMHSSSRVITRDQQAKIADT